MKFHPTMVLRAMNACATCPYGAILHEGQPICAKDGLPIKFFDGSYSCPDGRWVPELAKPTVTYNPRPTMLPLKYDEASKEYYIERPDMATEAFLDQHYRRIHGLRWKPKAQGLLAKGASFIQAVTSGRATDEVVARRKLSCFGDATTPPCPSMVQDARGKHCSACGCGRWTLAMLDGNVAPKLMWANLACPLGRPGFTNSRT